MMQLSPHIAIDEMNAALRGVLKDLKNPTLRKFGLTELEMISYSDHATLLQMATPYYWSKEPLELLKHVQQDFILEEICTDRYLLYTDVSFHWFETPLYHIQSNEGPLVPVHAITAAWAHGIWQGKDEELITCTAWVKHPVLHEVQPYITCSRIKGDNMAPGMKFDYGDDTQVSRDETRQLLLFVVAAGTFLRQRLLSAEKQPTSRAVLRRLKPHEFRPYTRVVALRRTQQKAPVLAGENTVSREYQWQWTVRGHVRQQWYPSTQSHLPVWIHPHVAGPEDKPLKPRTTPIISVRR